MNTDSNRRSISAALLPLYINDGLKQRIRQLFFRGGNIKLVLQGGTWICFTARDLGLSVQDLSHLTNAQTVKLVVARMIAWSMRQSGKDGLIETVSGGRKILSTKDAMIKTTTP